MTTLKAFHGDEKIKEKYLARVQAHRLADEIVKGKYWQDGKGCAIGCTIHSDDHAAYETELGIPEWLARVEDTLFEGMSNDLAKEWPEAFLSAIAPGANLDLIKTTFIIFILESTIESMNAVVFDREKNPDVAKAVEQSTAAARQMIEAHRTGGDLSAAESAARSARLAAESATRSVAMSAAWSAVESAARSARSAAMSAAWSAAESARLAAESATRSAAMSAAWSAVESAARSARSAATSAAWSAAESATRSVATSAVESATRSVATSAARSARSAASAKWSAAWSAAESAARSARSAAFERYADELLKLMRGCK